MTRPVNEGELQAVLLELQLSLAQNPAAQARERAQRHITRLTSALGATASLLALWDLLLLVRLGH